MDRPDHDGTRIDLSDITVEVVTDPAAAAAVAQVAAATFALACPPHSTPEDIAGFISTSLQESNFRDHIADPLADVVVARDGVGGPVIGYTLVLHTEPSHPDVCAVVTERPVSEVSKMYVLPDHHSRQGVTPSHQLMSVALDRARAHGSTMAWLGVNQLNVRAQRFYTKMGFTRVGVKTFSLNGSIEHDYVFTRSL
ncbi:GNAT family N-acetyltransferase [Gordonia sp. zg691]|uniref:GNAT family N-acetyltransferase n=1 Tax=Gordonia jinghuaiqii TaxID=2758710 RepID=A0A7D7LUS2_9ACTN|nr:GNAT family N-acetyltransferase [Gordonia jinghuaiqii]MBD0861421.1 GNAT family N-acetyltransferase [Gordonia jinghuaiqii]MCR5976321.1 GNAT family N-acetyltransferase [Gordonia jinghuaiqii]QMT03540.1 GNAT family N-acetyltransferase [Gordonia jinghuaiqii]